jgi:very-short-patch-repair endonuclease
MGTEILEILSSSSFPLHARDIRQVLVRSGTSMPEHDVLGTLRELMKEGRVEFTRGKWRSLVKSKPAQNFYRTHSGDLGTPSIVVPGSVGLPGWGQIPAPGGQIVKEEGATEKTDPRLQGPWGPFRTLLDYYCDCIRNEGGSEAAAQLDEINPKYLFISRSGLWLPRAGYPWRLTIPLSGHLGAFISELTSKRQDTLLVLGYPLQVICFQREGDPDYYLLKPIFHFALEFKLQTGALLLSVDDPRIQVNLEWLSYNFKDSNRKTSFLSACGFIGGDDDDVGFQLSPQVEHLTATLSAFMSRQIRESLTPNLISAASLRPPIDTGIYNRAVVMPARRPQYTRSLLRELAIIREASDEELDKTALRHLFRSPPSFEGSVQGEKTLIGVADVTPLNSEQRAAVSSLLSAPITVITGPPGTGKSQVVSAAVANGHLFGKSVLFASRNHKAIDAVYYRCRDNSDRPLLARCNSRDDPSLRFTFIQAITMLLSGEASSAVIEEAKKLLESLKLLLKDRNEKLQKCEKISECREILELLEEEGSILSLKIPTSVISLISERPEIFPANRLEKILSFKKVPSTSNGAKTKFTDLLSALSLSRSWMALRHGLSPFDGIEAPRGWLCTPARLSTFLEQSTLLQDAAAFCSCRKQIESKEAEVKALPDIHTMTSEMTDLTNRIAALTPIALERVTSARAGLDPGEDRELLANVRAALQYIDSGTAPAAVQESTRGVLQSQLFRLLQHVPGWAVTSLSIKSRIPLIPGIFDLAIIDEASQSDIPSAIPVLFRARRAGVVGDPRQLTHVVNLTMAKDCMLRRRAGLDRFTDQRFSYIETSLYSLFADTNGISPIFLSETYRSVEEIAAYSNDLFYGGRLRVATDPARLPLNLKMRPGIHWTEVEGEVQSGGFGGARCDKEIDATKALVREMLLDNNFRGTLGIVTPFREQANRLKDAVFQGDIPWEALKSADLAVDTSHGFQGGERDVVIFSLCAGPGMPAGALHFIRETGNLFNVAASRARAVLHVVGNKRWASCCGIRHVERLARPVRVAASGTAPGPWAPHESPWEKHLFEALKAVGLSPIPQHPVGYRRLDLALIRESQCQLKLDIEVDGASCHRNPDGSRKIDDVWRDIQLQGMGWRVMRFWVYQLREGMDDCVRKIMEVWNSHD